MLAWRMFGLRSWRNFCPFVRDQTGVRCVFRKEIPGPSGTGDFFLLGFYLNVDYGAGLPTEVGDSAPGGVESGLKAASTDSTILSAM